MYSLPRSDGAQNQLLQTDGNGKLSWVTVSGAGTPILSDVLSSGNNAQEDSINNLRTLSFNSAHDINITRDGEGYMKFLVDGNYEMGIHSNRVEMDSLRINHNYSFPSVDGSSDQVLQTDGSGTLSWATISSGSSSSSISDTDGNTKITTENSADEDTIRFFIDGTEKIKFGGKSLEILDNYQSTMIGENTGKKSTGYYNVLLGYNSGYSLGNGGNNVFVGTLSGFSNTSGDRNTFIGTEAGYNFNGNENILIGNRAAYENTTGDENVFIGERVAEYFSGGNSNVIMGYKTGYEAGGNNNVFIGTYSGWANDGSGNIFIGYGAGQDVKGSNKLFIENSPSLTPLVYGNFSDDSLKIFGTLSIGNNYTFPSSDGNSDEVLQTDGNGNLSWASVSGAGTPTLAEVLAAGKDANNLGMGNIDSIGFMDDWNIDYHSGDASLLNFKYNGETKMELSSNYVEIDKLNIGFHYTFPENDGNNGQIMQTDGSGNVSWADFSQPGLESVLTTNNNAGNGSINYLQSLTFDSEYSTGIYNPGEGFLQFKHDGNTIMEMYDNYLTIDSMRINDMYALPSSDGAANQVLQTDGSGALSWATVSGAATPTLKEVLLAGNGANEIGIDSLAYISATNNWKMIFEAAESNWIDFRYNTETLMRLNETYIEIDSLRINYKYSLPSVDGSANQVLQTDGSGKVSWATISGGSSSSSISDTDGNTKITTENSADEDTIRFFIDGTEKIKFGGKSLEILDNYQSTMIGENTGKKSTGYYNVLLGYNSGYSLGNGGNNVFVGTLSGFSNTSGDRNTFIGTEAGYNFNGNENILIGNRAAYENTTGDENVFIGERVAEYFSGGNSNVIMGYKTGYEAGGNNNVFIGTYSGWANDGSGNIFIGYGAGQDVKGSNKLFIENSPSLTPLVYGNFSDDSLKIFGTLSIGNNYTFPSSDGNSDEVLQTDGYGNLSWASMEQDTLPKISLGNDSLLISSNAFHFYLEGTERMKFSGQKLSFLNNRNNIYLGNTGTGSQDNYNVFIGDGSGNSNDWGDYNVFIGHNSGYNNATILGGNVFIGHEAAYNCSNGDRNIFIGYQAGYNETGSNKLYIENTNSSSPLIYGEFDNDYLKFNADSVIVTGFIRADSLVTEFNSYADYVFADDYNLSTFEEQVEYWNANNSLPALSKHSKNVSRRLEHAVEELEKAYLYMEQQQNKIEELEQQNQGFEQRLKAIEEQIANQ